MQRQPRWPAPVILLTALVMAGALAWLQWPLAAPLCLLCGVAWVAAVWAL